MIAARMIDGWLRTNFNGTKLRLLILTVLSYTKLIES